MYRTKNTNQTKDPRTYNWIIQNRIKSSFLVFILMVVVGSSYLLVNMFNNRNASKSATAQEEVAKAGDIPGWWYSENFGASVCDEEKCEPESDPDNDKLSNYQEYFYSSDPNNKDTNANGNSDGEDVAFGLVPNKPGKVSFEEAGSDETILGESLAYNDEIKDVIVGMSDFSKVVTPEVSDSDLKISKEASRDAFVNYILALNSASAKYQVLSNIEEAIKQQDQRVLQEINLLSAKIVIDFMNVEVPADAVQLHKYQIALWRIMPKVATIPASDNNLDALFDQGVNEWYDSVQSMIALNQKILAELSNLRTKYTY